jgi:hypothetical protein
VHVTFSPKVLFLSNFGAFLGKGKGVQRQRFHFFKTKISSPKNVAFPSVFEIAFLDVSWQGDFSKKHFPKMLFNSGTVLVFEEPTDHIEVRHFCFECPL